jgi:hypothetical protein
MHRSWNEGIWCRGSVVRAEGEHGSVLVAWVRRTSCLWRGRWAGFGGMLRWQGVGVVCTVFQAEGVVRPARHPVGGTWRPAAPAGG